MLEVDKVLAKLEELNFIRLGKVTGDYQTAYCPFHKDGKERKPSFGILLRTQVRAGTVYEAGWCHCFTCGYAKSLPNMVTDLLKLHNTSQSGYDWLSDNIPGFSADANIDYLIDPSLSTALQSKYAVSYLQGLQNKKVDYVSEDELSKYRYTVPYMYERKLTDEIIEKFDIGYDADWVPPGKVKPVPCITFPVRDKSGGTLFFCRRSIQGKLYNYPEGIVKPLYGIDMIPANCRSLIVAESCINALTAWTWGFPAVALMGTGNTYQMQQLRELGCPEIIICTDGDDAGRRAIKRIKNHLKSCAIVWSVSMPDGKDINDITKEEFIELLKLKE